MYANGSDEEKAYKRANESFHNLLAKYDRDEKKHRYLFKGNNESEEYNFTEAHIQLLKFIKKIDLHNPVERTNKSLEKQSLKKFKEAANEVEKEINSPKYPDITDILKSSLRTKEFLSLYSIYDLVVKIVQLFQYACESYYADFTIYEQVNKYLDTLLYTYAGTKICGEMMQEEYKKVHDILVHNAHEYNGKLEFKSISIYNGFNSYTGKLFDTVINDEHDSLAIDIEGIQNFKYDYRYEFKDLESLRNFLETYFSYCQKSIEFHDIIKNDEIYLDIVSIVYSILLGEFNFMDISVDGMNSNIKFLGQSIYKAYEKIKKNLLETNEISKELKEKCSLIIDLQEKFQDDFCFTYGNGDMLRLWNYLGYVKTQFKDTRNHKHELAFDITEAIFYDFIIGNMTYIDQNEHRVELPISMQISYKNFPMTLNMLSDFKRYTGLPNEKIVDKIIKALQNTEEQINTDLKCDDELFTKIDNAIGIYLSNLFETSQVNGNKTENK